MAEKQQVVVHSAEEIQKIRRVTEITAEVRNHLCQAVKPGMTTWEIDQLGKSLIEEKGGTCAFHNYRGFPGHVCVSVDDVIVHGIGSINHRMSGDSIMSVDVGIRLDGVVGDSASTVAVGGNDASAEVKHLLNVGQKSLEAGIEAARGGNRVNHISKAIEKIVKSADCNVVREYVGHGCGVDLHEPPEIPNFSTPNAREKLVPGMVLAIEPMVTTGNAQVAVDSDGWTARTKDGKPAVHFEHMVLVTKGKAEVLTCRKNSR